MLDETLGISISTHIYMIIIVINTNIKRTIYQLLLFWLEI